MKAEEKGWVIPLLRIRTGMLLGYQAQILNSLIFRERSESDSDSESGSGSGRRRGKIKVDMHT